MEDNLARKQAEDVTLKRARLLGMSYFDTSLAQDKPLFQGILPVADMHQYKVIPIDVQKSNILFGIKTTTSQVTMQKLSSHFNDQRVAFAIISDIGFDEYMKLYDPPKQVVYQDISLSDKGQESIAAISQTLEKVSGDDVLAYLVKQAHQLNASDIHIETNEQGARIRLRIDGVLHPIAVLSPEKHRVLMSEIASAGNVSTGTSDAQQGHISKQYAMKDGALVDVNIRLETVQTIHGMDAVMRLFNMSQERYTLDRLGLSELERAVVDDIVTKPTGMVLVVGPTGSGKTTTLYSMLNTLNTSERKIITVEDPVEYRFAGITQISVNSRSSTDNNFADKLRAVLRLDPDVVMVGEIRDLDTAKTGLQASLTGHLVLSTFHASSAAAALTRLMDIIGENPLFLSAIRLVMAQRLVRRLDDETKEAYSLDDGLRQKLQQIIDSLPSHVERPDLNSAQLFRPRETPENPFGYKGQIALREQYVMTDELRQILSEPSKRFSTQEIENVAVRNGMTTMLQDGVLKALRGETSLQEIYRVLG